MSTSTKRLLVIEAEPKQIRRYKLITIDAVGNTPFDQDDANLCSSSVPPATDNDRPW